MANAGKDGGLGWAVPLVAMKVPIAIFKSDHISNQGGLCIDDSSEYVCTTKLLLLKHACESPPEGCGWHLLGRRDGMVLLG